MEKTVTKHEYENTIFRGIETSHPKRCIHCEVLRYTGNRFVKSHWLKDGEVLYKSPKCITRKIQDDGAL